MIKSGSGVGVDSSDGAPVVFGLNENLSHGATLPFERSAILTRRLVESLQGAGQRLKVNADCGASWMKRGKSAIGKAVPVHYT